LRDRTTDAEYYYAVSGLYLLPPTRKTEFWLLQLIIRLIPRLLRPFFSSASSISTRKTTPRRRVLAACGPDNLTWSSGKSRSLSWLTAICPEGV
jgi:hypothetical protein